MYCNVPLHAVVEVRDVDHTIYELPLTLQEEKLDETVCRALRLDTPAADMTDWRRFVERVIHPRKHLKVGVVGKYIDLQDAYKSIYESMTHAGAANDCGVDTVPRLRARSTAPYWTPGAAPGSRIISRWLPSPRATPPSGDPTYRRSASSAGTSLTVAKGNSPPRGVKITEHSTIMGVF